MKSENGLVYVGFLPRFLAIFVDTIWIALLSAPILYLVFGPEYFNDEALQKTPASRAAALGIAAVAMILFWMFRSTTPGKMVVKSKIVDAKTGAPLSKKQSLLRYIGYYLAGVPLFLGFLWTLWDPKRQGWHDKLAGSVVVRVDS